RADDCEYCRRAAPKEGIAKLLAGEAVVLEPEGLRRKQRRVKKLDAEKKTRRKTALPAPAKQMTPELIPLESLLPMRQVAYSTQPKARNGKNGN
ncbi:MAG: hypothetical protein HY070_02710, partial [Chloroflexi bacterium]|nr:hypothetical protein [Chloroflexota bacterium]